MIMGVNSYLRLWILLYLFQSLKLQRARLYVRVVNLRA